jgi:hypothetical protein
MAFSISIATDKQLLNWDSFVEHSANGTLFHTRRFLCYHGDRFRNSERYLIIKKGDDVVGQIALSIQIENNVTTANSPYGASYGGVVLRRVMSYGDATKIVVNLIDWLQQNNIDQFKLTFPLDIFANDSHDTFKFVFLENGFRSVNRDICSVIKLKEDIEYLLSGKTRNVIKTAIKRGVKIMLDTPLEKFWKLVEMTYNRHGKNPTHTQDELRRLMQLFPSKIRTHTAEFEGASIAGICEFTLNKRVESAFYFCRNPEFDRLQGLSVLVENALQRAKALGFVFYDFGTSSLNMLGRANIFSFKEGFGSTGVFRETFLLDLKKIKEKE